MLSVLIPLIPAPCCILVGLTAMELVTFMGGVQKWVWHLGGASFVALHSTPLEWTPCVRPGDLSATLTAEYFWGLAIWICSLYTCTLRVFNIWCSKWTFNMEEFKQHVQTIGSLFGDLDKIGLSVLQVASLLLVSFSDHIVVVSPPLLWIVPWTYDSWHSCSASILWCHSGLERYTGNM